MALQALLESVTPMASLTIRNLDDGTKGQLRLRAARHGRSMEEEARTILREAVTVPSKPNDGLGLGSRIAAHFADLGGIELGLPQRISPAQPAIFADLGLLDQQSHPDPGAIEASTWASAARQCKGSSSRAARLAVQSSRE